MSEESNPGKCNLCNSDFIKVQSDPHRRISTVSCGDCGHFITTDLPEEDAIVLWNTRPLEDELVTALELAVHEMEAWPGYGDTLDDTKALIAKAKAQ